MIVCSRLIFKNILMRIIQLFNVNTSICFRNSVSGIQKMVINPSEKRESGILAAVNLISVKVVFDL